MIWAANARMYSMPAATAAAWKEVLAWTAQQSGVELAVVDHAFPAPLSALWSREDLGCAFMCGLPWIRSRSRPKPIAAPVPSPARYADRPVYMTDLIVRADSPFRTLEDTFGARLGFTVEDSHSGFNALRHHLLPHRIARAADLYRQSVGPLHTPRRVIDAVLAGDIDVGPLDGYALDLMLKHDPELAARIRVIATSDAAPIPFLVASPSCPDDVVERLREPLLRLHLDTACDWLRQALLLSRFVRVETKAYALIADWDRAAIAAGYAVPG